MTPFQEFLTVNEKLIDQIIIDWGFPKGNSSFNTRKAQTEEWFENFNHSEYEDALLILKKVQYYNDIAIKKYLKLGSQELENIFGDDLKSVLFYPLGLSSASSGSQYLYDLLKSLGLPKENFKSDDFKLHLNKDISIVFIDDIIGSGNQATRFFKTHLSNATAECHYISLFGYEEGIRKVKREAGFKSVIECKKLTNEDMAFSENSFVFKDKEERERLKLLCEKHGKELYPLHPLGYDNSQALLVFPHNTPNNTLPIIWAGPNNEKVEGKIWRPLWERKKVKKTEATKNERQIGNNNRLNFFSKPSKLFTGRTKKIEEITSAFENNDIISLTGIGGIGKTQLVLKLLEQIRPIYKGEITWQDFLDSTRFDNFIIASGFGDIIQSNNEEKDKFLALIDKFNEYSRIIVWDNFHDNKDETFLNFISFAKGKLNGAKIIIISRTSELITGLKNIELTDFEEGEEYVKILIQERHSKLELSESDIKDICRYVKGHPLAIELTLNLCESLSLKNVIGKLALFNIRTDELSKRLFQEILDSGNTNDLEKEFLYQFSIFKDKVLEEDILEIFGKETLYILPSLKEKYLIGYDSHHYDTHPLIREFCYNELKNKRTLHSRVADWLISKRTIELDTLLEERVYHHLIGAERVEEVSFIIIKYGREYLRRALFQTLLEMLDFLNDKGINLPLFDILRGDIYQIIGDFDNAYLSFEKAKNNVTDLELAVEGLLKYGDVFRLNSKHDKALELFIEAELISKSNDFKKYIAWSYNNISLIKDVKGFYQEAFDLKIKALEITEELQIKEDLATLYNNVGAHFKDRRYKIYNLIKALDYLKKSLALNIELGNKQGMGHVYCTIGMLYADENLKDFNLNTALDYINKSLEINLEIGSKLGISNAYNGIGIIYSRKDFEKFDRKKSIENFKKGLHIKIDIGDRVGAAAIYWNLGATQHKEELYKDSLINLFTSYSIYKELDLKSKFLNVKDEIGYLKDLLTKSVFVNYANLAIEELNPEIKKYIVLSEFLNEPLVVEKRPSRNDIIEVKYEDGEIVKKKYKYLKKDIESGKCVIIHT